MSSGLLTWAQGRSWAWMAASAGLHLAVAALFSAALIRPAEFGMVAGDGGAAGGAPGPLMAVVEIAPPEPERVPESATAPATEPTPEPEPVPQDEPDEPDALAVAAPPPAESAAPPRPVAAARPAAAAQEGGSGSGGARTAARPDHLRNPAPPYPEAARRRGQEGTVVIEAEITAQGRVASARVAQSSGFPLLDEAALGAVRRYRFQPATVAGVPIASTTRQPIRFDLKGGNH